MLDIEPASDKLKLTPTRPSFVIRTSSSVLAFPTLFLHVFPGPIYIKSRGYPRLPSFVSLLLGPLFRIDLPFLIEGINRLLLSYISASFFLSGEAIQLTYLLADDRSDVGV
jgi:hypothetical protein